MVSAERESFGQSESGTALQRADTWGPFYLCELYIQDEKPHLPPWWALCWSTAENCQSPAAVSSLRGKLLPRAQRHDLFLVERASLTGVAALEEGMLNPSPPPSVFLNLNPPHLGGQNPGAKTKEGKLPVKLIILFLLQEQSIAKHINRKLRKQLSMFRVPPVLSYVHKKMSVSELEYAIKIWERKVEIAEVRPCW